MRYLSTLLLVLLLPALSLLAEDNLTSEIRSAITKAIPLIEKASKGSTDQRKCFTCHNQAVPVFALTAAKQNGFTVNEENLGRQVKHTAEHLKRGQSNYLKGKGQGGKVVTAGYALWALDTADHESSKTTTAVVDYLLKHQDDKNHWSQTSKRPPSSGSPFMTTYVALRAIHYYGIPEQQSKIDSRVKKVATWLNSATAKDTEDLVFQLRAFEYIELTEGKKQKVISELLELQRTDGGWAQISELESDAYATGTVLVALIEAGVKPKSPAVQKGIQYLLKTQHADGSWQVKTRADGFQEYFETGFPYEEDQYISTSASSWSTLALILSISNDSSFDK